MNLNIQLERFEGPLGLLLHLIRKEELDIYNIPMNRVTEQYLEYIKTLKELDLEVAGEFITMAATLILIKSKMLLPTYNEQGEEVEIEDPRKELVQKLIEYQKYQEASKKLNSRVLVGRDVFLRGASESVGEIDLTEEDLDDGGGLFALISMYRVLVKKMKKRVHTVFAKGQSIASRILEIKDRFLMGQKIELRELISAAEASRTKLLITFLSLLELGRLGFVSLFQAENYGPLYVEMKQNIDRDVVARVQEYETPGTQAQLQMTPDSEIISQFVDQEPEVVDTMASDEDIEMAEQEMKLSEGLA